MKRLLPGFAPPVLVLLAGETMATAKGTAVSWMKASDEDAAQQE
jgi:hypothetical protein